MDPGPNVVARATSHRGELVLRRRYDGAREALELRANGVFVMDTAETSSERALAITALDLVRTRGGAFGVATNRVAVMGFSAGGHLAARLAREVGPAAPPAAVLLVYPAYLLANGALAPEVTPSSRAPIWIYTAADDRISAAESRALATWCREHDTRCELEMPPGGGHGFGIKPDRPAPVQAWPEQLRAFLDEVMP